MDPIKQYWFLNLPTEGVSHPNSLLSSRRLVQLDVVVQLTHLLGELLIIWTALSCLDLDGKDLKLKLQDLVLDLAVLQGGCFSIICGSIDPFIEATSTDLGIFSDLTLVLEGLKVFLRDRGQVSDLGLC